MLALYRYITPVFDDQNIVRFESDFCPMKFQNGMQKACTGVSQLVPEVKVEQQNHQGLQFPEESLLFDCGVVK